MEMKYFYATVSTQYDGYEWLERAVLKTKNRADAVDKVSKFDFTHDGIGEIQEIMNVKEIGMIDYITLKKYLINII